jgi:hypothetical protein
MIDVPSPTAPVECLSADIKFNLDKSIVLSELP